MAITRIISANESPPQSSSFLSSRKYLSINNASSSSSSSRSSTLSTEKSSSLSTGATSPSSSLSRMNSKIINEMNQVEQRDDDGVPRTFLDSERISDVMAARLVTCLLGHVLYLKGQIPFPITQLIKMSERRRQLADTDHQRIQQAKIRAYKKQDELLAAFDLLSSHLKSTFSSLSTALARNSRKYPNSSTSTSKVIDGKISFHSSSRPPAKAHVVFALGASATNVNAARSKVVMEIEGLEVKIWGERYDRSGSEDSTDEVDDGDGYNEDALSVASSPPRSDTSSSSETDDSDVERRSAEEGNSDISDSDDEIFDTDKDESEEDSLLQDEEEEDSIISRLESLTVRVQEANTPDTETLRQTTTTHVLEYEHNEVANLTPKATLPLNTVIGILPSLSFDSVSTSNSNDLSSPHVSTPSNLSTPVHIQNTSTDTTPINFPKTILSSSTNRQNDYANTSSPSAIPPRNRSNKSTIDVPHDDEASLRAAERLLSRTLMMANAENNGLADDIPPSKIHIFIRAPRRFEHPAWIPQITAGKALDKLVDESMKSNHDFCNSLNQQQRRRSSMKLKSRSEGIKVGCQCRVDGNSDADKSEDVTMDENDELIWWSWDGKLVGFSEL